MTPASRRAPPYGRPSSIGVKYSSRHQSAIVPQNGQPFGWEPGTGRSTDSVPVLTAPTHPVPLRPIRPAAPCPPRPPRPPPPAPPPPEPPPPPPPPARSSPRSRPPAASAFPPRPTRPRPAGTRRRTPPPTHPPASGQ